MLFLAVCSRAWRTGERSPRHLLWPEACCHGRLGAIRKTFGKNVAEIGLPCLVSFFPVYQRTKASGFQRYVVQPMVVRGAHRGIWMGPGTILEGWF